MAITSSAQISTHPTANKVGIDSDDVPMSDDTDTDTGPSTDAEIDETYWL